ncbi:MAG TPA: hypothetical protein VFM18_12710 [Methanosarcina sp.]|nr:hypothetical protein [Methanosarcina sp.]
MLKFTTGHYLNGNEQIIDGNTIRVTDDSGRCLFEVTICHDQASIEVRGVETHKIKDVVHTTSLLVKPNYANCVTIKTERYE